MNKSNLYLEKEQLSLEPTNQEIPESNYQKSAKRDLKHNVSNLIREEIKTSYQPSKNSISELVFNNNIEGLLKKINKNTIDFNLRDGEGATSSWTPLYWAVKLSKIDMITILLNNGADINLVINDSEECCGTVLDLATIRGDVEIESLLRTFATKEDVSFGQAFKAIRTKLRGKAPSFNFRNYSKVNKES